MQQSITLKILHSNTTLDKRRHKFSRRLPEWIKATESTLKYQREFSILQKTLARCKAQNKFNFNLLSTRTLIHSGATDEDTDLG